MSSPKRVCHPRKGYVIPRLDRGIYTKEYQMKKIKNFLVVLALVGVVSTQSGCLIGGAASNPGIVGAGSVLFWSGLIAENAFDRGVLHPDQQYYANWAMYIGIVLDSKNPGRIDALNALPLDETVANKQSVSIEDLETYNDELNEVIVANSEIEALLQKSISEEGLSQDEVMAMVNKLGLESFDELVEIMQADSLINNVLELFSNAFNLSPKTAELYLKLRWVVN
jgi:hypothetical protein